MVQAVWVTQNLIEYMLVSVLSPHLSTRMFKPNKSYRPALLHIQICNGGFIGLLP